MAFYKNVVILLAIVICGIGAQAQSLDSLEQVLQTQKLTPGEQVQILSKLFTSVVKKDTLLATSYIHRMEILQEKRIDSLSRAIFYQSMGDFCKQKDDLSGALQNYEKSIHAINADSSERAQTALANVLLRKGEIYHQLDDYEAAYSNYLEAETLFLKYHQYNELISLYGRMGNIFLRNSNFERNEQITEKAEAIIDKITDPNVLASYYTNKGGVAAHNEDYQDAGIQFGKALAILEKTQDQYRLGTLYYNMGYLLRIQEKFGMAEAYYRQSLTAFEKSGVKFDICDGILGIGKILFYQGKYSEAEPHMIKALQMAEEIKSKLLIRNSYIFLSYLEHGRGNYKKAFEYQERGLEYEIELLSEDTQKQLNAMAVKYELAQKESSIKELESKTAIQQAQVKLRGTLLTSALIVVFIFIVFVFFYIRYSRHKQQLAASRIRQLEQEQQLVATQAVLDGETAERTRLARDLHDGLGGMLSVVKLNLNDMRNGVSIESEDVIRFDRVVGLLDESIRELRRVAHNMMPDSLSRYGLRASLNDFCNSIPGAVFSHYGDDGRLDPKLEVMIYRTVHELVNNALKHAGATEIIVQMIQEYDRISITVQDDGCGFDPAAPTSGTGLNNIRNRVGSYNGRMDVYSEPDKGTEVSVEFKL